MDPATQRDPFDLLDWFVGRIDGVLGTVGLTLSPLELQAVLVVAAIIVGVASAWGLRGKPPDIKRWLAVAAMVLVVGFVVGRWAHQLLVPDPDFIQGEVVAGSHSGMEVALLGFRDEAFAPGGDTVDSLGRFAFHYERRLGDWPRRIRVRRDGCAPQLYPLSRAALRAGSPLRVEYRCGESQ